jgi:hypothetical protein
MKTNAKTDIQVSTTKERKSTKEHLLEKDIQRRICDWLATQRQLFFWRSNNTPIFDVKKGIFRALPKYTPKGLPDIMVLLHGNFIGLEVKKPNYHTTRSTDGQTECQISIKENGGQYYTVTSLNDVIDLMYQYVPLNMRRVIMPKDLTIDNFPPDWDYEKNGYPHNIEINE